jgi:transposase-like protein
MSRKRRNHSPKFKAKVALTAIKGDETLSEIARRFDINANLIVKWKKQLLENSEEVFASGKGLAPDRETEIKELQAKIGEITMVNDFLSRALDR